MEKVTGEMRRASKCQVTVWVRRASGYKVKRGINRKFIIGAIKAFPGYNLDDLFYVDSEGQPVKSSN